MHDRKNAQLTLIPAWGRCTGLCSERANAPVKVMRESRWFDGCRCGWGNRALLSCYSNRRNSSDLPTRENMHAFLFLSLSSLTWSHRHAFVWRAKPGQRAGQAVLQLAWCCWGYQVTRSELADGRKLCIGGLVCVSVNALIELLCVRLVMVAASGNCLRAPLWTQLFSSNQKHIYVLAP